MVEVQSWTMRKSNNPHLELSLVNQVLNIPTTDENSPEMLSFFGDGVAASLPLSKAKNISNVSWWKDVPGGSNGDRKDHENVGLVVATVACGAAVVAFLILAALHFLFQYQMQRSNGRAK